MQPSRDEDLDQVSHVVVTSGDSWHHTVLDHLINIKNHI